VIANLLDRIDGGGEQPVAMMLTDASSLGSL
jgi:hypothetical protein